MSSTPALLAAFEDRSGSAWRQLLAVTEAMGFSRPVAEAGLAAELDAWAAPGAVASVLRELDGTSPSQRPKTVLVVAASTLPVSLLRQALFARLLGARVLVKPASGQEALAAALQVADPACVPRCFASSDAAARDRAIAEADAVVVLGGDETVASVRAAVPPGTPFVGYGHRVSAAWLADPPTDDDLRGLAADVCAWDQAGCLSPQVAWVHGDPAAVGPRLAEALAEVEATLPMTLPRAAGPSRLAAHALGDMAGVTWSTDTAVVAALPSPAFRSSHGHRFLWLLPADPAALAPVAPYLSTVAVAGRLPGGLPGSVRVCRPGEMQRPPLSWPHDGRPNLRPMLG